MRIPPDYPPDMPSPLKRAMGHLTALNRGRKSSLSDLLVLMETYDISLKDLEISSPDFEKLKSGEIGVVNFCADCGKIIPKGERHCGICAMCT